MMPHIAKTAKEFCAALRSRCYHSTTAQLATSRGRWCSGHRSLIMKHIVRNVPALLVALRLASAQKHTGDVH
jgi:hypothetical protein